ncbi:type II inositol polyphosphate 5-phosphatase 15-like isoform X2 [Lolium rigidum]|uniref:type II inositol polyphosphate 5-phosphatase 15-like isoform X2 n=1 Tax=Lolium rigidum TaxID=89674 RepID=UPI001F5D1FFD|nr:type II inositol polyphosphate 5-phosphatase 15-like isoform X2 [Lolium rigidum]
MVDPGEAATPSAAVSSPWDDIPDDFFLFASISSPCPPPAPAPILCTSPSPPQALRSSFTSTHSASAYFSDSLHHAESIHPSHSLPALSAASRSAAADVWHPPPGPHHSNSLPEFSASVSESHVHRPPPSNSVRADRPPPLELRPRPPRESQAGTALRALACFASPASGTSTHLWAAGDAGVRVWDLADAFRSPTSRRRWGDEASAPFRESRRTPPALCLVADPGRGVVWSGHTDGRIMAWSADRGPEAGECIGWDAHRGPVFALAISPYGDLWSGSEGGIIKVWYGEAIEKSLALQREEKCKTSLLVERSFVDLWIMVSDGGACPLPAVDVKLLLSDNSRSKVWSAGYLSFALWDSRTKELLKVVNVNGQVDSRFDVIAGQDSYGHETKENLFSSPKKDKARSPVNFFQRSRNALLGAADAVRRVAAKAGLGDDTQRIEALAMSMNGMIWTGSANGSLSQWDGCGNRLQEFQHHPSSVQSIAIFGTKLWVGYMDGNIQLLDLEGNLLGGWTAHSSSPILSMTVGSSYIFTLAGHGGVSGWNLSSPGPTDSILHSELMEKETSYKNIEYIKVLVCSWNVGQEKASYESLRAWLKFPTAEVGVVVVGLQEVEMGAGFLAMSAAKETVGLEGSPNGEWWLDAIGKILKGHSFERVGSRQMAGLLTAVWVKTNLKCSVGDIDNAAVACGLGRAIGNKGAVGLRMRIHDRSICFVNCHFAAHMEAVSRRNEDFEHVFRTMAFATPSSGLLTTSISSSAGQLLRANGSRIPELSDTDMIVFLGDFNYRLYDISYDDAMSLVSRRCFDWLRKNDQLRVEMSSGRVFQGLREAHFKFPPTYKFEKHKAGLSGYRCKNVLSGTILILMRADNIPELLIPGTLV